MIPLTAYIGMVNARISRSKTQTMANNQYTRTNPGNSFSLTQNRFNQMGIFVCLHQKRAADAMTVAEACGLDLRGTRLLLEACAALELVNKEGGLYRNTPEAEMFLVPGSPGDLSGAIRYNRDVFHAWGRLADMVRSGRPVERPALHLGEHPDRTRTFVMAMHGRALGIGRAVVPQLDLAGCRSVLDVGGGPGTYSVLISRAYPDIRCTVIDLPAIAAIAEELVRTQQAADRVTVMPGDYHTVEFPAGQDAVLFLGVLHQEPQDMIRNLLARAYAALNPGGQVVILDMMTEQFKIEAQTKHIHYILKSALDPLDWESKVSLIRGMIKNLQHVLPEKTRSQPPERFAGKYELIVNAYVESIDNMNSIFRRL